MPQKFVPVTRAEFRDAVATMRTLPTQHTVVKEDNSTVVLTGNGIAFFQLASLRSRLSLECKGMRCRGESAYSQAKRVYNLRGNKASVLAQLEAMVEKAITEEQARKQHTIDRMQEEG